MPTIQGTDNFNHGDFTIPGGGPYADVNGTPAKDTTIVHSPDPASLLIATAGAEENVQYAVSGSPTLPWHGFWFRLESADEPASNTMVAHIGTVDDAYGALEFQPSANNFFQYIAGGSNFPQGATYTFGTWVWIEQILDCGGGTRSIYCRIGGVDLTPGTRTIAASPGTNVALGSRAAAPTIPAFRYSNTYWGVAASVTDFMGPPVSGQTLRPASDVATAGWATAPLFSKINDSSDATVISATAS